MNDIFRAKERLSYNVVLTFNVWGEIGREGVGMESGRAGGRVGGRVGRREEAKKGAKEGGGEGGREEQSEGKRQMKVE